jgi:ATP-dependent RNA helicase DOB1
MGLHPSPQPALSQGKPSPLVSSFKLSYYTMLNMMRRLEGGEAGMETVVAKSFQQYQTERQLPAVWCDCSVVRLRCGRRPAL